MNKKFGEAIEHMQAGGIAYRHGWNGKGMFLFITTPKIEHTFGHREHHVYPVVPSICMKTAQDTVVVGWLASQTDMLADDWVLS